jgi:hypothetical protein
MQMDSYYFQDDAPFFAAGIPGSPDLPFADLIASLSEPLPAPDSQTFADLTASLSESLPAPASQSAFQEYSGGRTRSAGSGRSSSSVNIHRRMMGVLDRMGPGSGEEEVERPQQPQQQHAGAVESSRGFRHMMRERQRREKLSQSYADLYAMVSSRSKVRLSAMSKPQRFRAKFSNSLNAIMS